MYTQKEVTSSQKFHAKQITDPRRLARVDDAIKAAIWRVA